MPPLHAAVRQSSPPTPGGADAGDKASSSRNDETTRSATTAGPFEQAPGSIAAGGSAGSGASQPAGSRPANGRVSRYRCAMSSFSSALYSGNSITASHLRTGRILQHLR